MPHWKSWSLHADRPREPVDSPPYSSAESKWHSVGGSGLGSPSPCGTGLNTEGTLEYTDLNFVLPPKMMRNQAEVTVICVVIWLSPHTIGTAKGIGLLPFSHCDSCAEHVVQHIWEAQDLSWSQSCIQSEDDLPSSLEKLYFSSAWQMSLPHKYTKFQNFPSYVCTLKALVLSRLTNLIN